ncbi:hypothetical protein D915_010887 [Fasciola hepatica]|uniref:Uncharacterized protein n=1 Tax=Fasciola hepatica TaxID=6192 RepID=A0A4E0QYN8_FASHE|nr:hypothetical protein D915_010887 [Fasciola hepatica]
MLQSANKGAPTSELLITTFFFFLSLSSRSPVICFLYFLLTWLAMELFKRTMKFNTKTRKIISRNGVNKIESECDLIHHEHSHP